MRKPRTTRTPALDSRVLATLRHMSQQKASRQLGISQSLIQKIVRESQQVAA
jgi:predicted DNA-binding protein (UPF0251 family)